VSVTKSGVCQTAIIREKPDGVEAPPIRFLREPTNVSGKVSAGLAPKVMQLTERMDAWWST
jgi:hypothetical protein